MNFPVISSLFAFPLFYPISPKKQQFILNDLQLFFKFAIINHLKSDEVVGHRPLWIYRKTRFTPLPSPA